MTYEEILITKDIADAMISRNTQNYRKVNWNLVHKYARAMEQGLWRSNGEPIIFDEDGLLKDGQHRLLAVLEYGVPVKMLVVRGVSRDVNTFDEGGGRTATQRARAEGLNLDGSTLGAVSMLLNKMDRNIYIGNDEKVRYGWEHIENLKKAELFCRRGKLNGLMKKSACIAAIYCGIELGLMPDEMLEAFCAIVNTGMPKDDYVPDSALALRNTIVEGIRAENSETIYTGSTIHKPLFEVTWQAMNGFLEGKKLKRRRITPDGRAQAVIKRVIGN